MYLEQDFQDIYGTAASVTLYVSLSDICKYSQNIQSIKFILEFNFIIYLSNYYSLQIAGNKMKQLEHLNFRTVEEAELSSLQFFSHVWHGKYFHTNLQKD